MSDLTIKEREIDFNKLYIYPIKGIGKHILYMGEYIANWKNLKGKAIDASKQ